MIPEEQAAARRVAALAARITGMAALVAAERMAQGLPPTITDPAVLEAAADLLLPAGRAAGILLDHPELLSPKGSDDATRDYCYVP